MYEIVLEGWAERTLRGALDDLVHEWQPCDGGMSARIGDQSALVAAIGRLHDLGIAIERVQRVR